MLVTLPYEMPELVTRAPLDIHTSTVLPEWVDWNGHMNLAFYVTAFDQASGAFMRNIGLGRRYVDGKHGMTFVLETHVTYDREMKGGVYSMREVAVGLDGTRAVKARAFVVDRRHKNYAGRLAVEETARLILQGIGGRGPCREYLENTVRQLEGLGLVDGPLHRLEMKVKELAANFSPCAASP